MSDVTSPLSETAARLPSHIRWLVAIGVVVMILVVVSVVETLHASSGAGASAKGESPGFFVPKSDKPVPFALPVLAAGEAPKDVSFSSEVGKPMVLNLWSTTCTVCVQETPAIESVVRRVGNRVKFIGIDTLDSVGPALAFVHRYGVTYQQLFDKTGTVVDGYKSPGLPVSIFVSASGKVVGENLGALTAKSLEHYLKVLFGTSS